MSFYPTCTSENRPSNPLTGDTRFETDTNSIIIWNGTNWLAYGNDGLGFGSSTYSLELDGTDDRVELGNLSFLNSASAFSLSFWVKIPSTASTTSALMFYQSGSAFENSIGFYQSPNNIDFLVGKGPTDQYAGTRYASDIRDGAWHHLAGVYDGSSIEIYLDGSVPTQSTIGSVVPTVPTSTRPTAGNDARIGSNITDGEEMEGYMDDFAIFDAALTASEVSNIKDNAFYPPSKLKHLYRFENNFNDSFGSVNGTAQANATTTNSTARP